MSPRRVRKLLAELGFKHITEIVGRSDLLVQEHRARGPGRHWSTSSSSFSPDMALCRSRQELPADRRAGSGVCGTIPNETRSLESAHHRGGARRDRRPCQNADLVFRIRNSDRSVGRDRGGNDRPALRPGRHAEPSPHQGPLRGRGGAEFRRVVHQRARPGIARLRPGRRGQGHFRRHGGGHARLSGLRLRRRDPERGRQQRRLRRDRRARSSSAAGPGTGSASAIPAPPSSPKPPASTPAST